MVLSLIFLFRLTQYTYFHCDSQYASRVAAVEELLALMRRSEMLIDRIPETFQPLYPFSPDSVLSIPAPLEDTEQQRGVQTFGGRFLLPGKDKLYVWL